MHAQRWITGISLGLFALACSTVVWSRPTAAVVADAAASRVTVTYQDPHDFAETRDFPFQTFDHGDYLQRLQAYLVRRAAPMLQPGEHLAVTFTDIKLAGSYEPWHGILWQDVRFMRDIYPPRMTFQFQLTGADGKLIREGKRTLIGTGYLYTLAVPGGSTNPLRFDEALLARWLRRGPQRW